MGANAQTSVPTFTAGEILTAANMNISARTGIPVFATTTTRDAAFGGTGEKTLAEGQFAYLEDSNTTQYYDGAAWQNVGVVPGLNFVTSGTVTSGSTITVDGCFTSTYSNYIVKFSAMTLSGAGSLTNSIQYRTSGATNSTTNYFSARRYMDTSGTAFENGATSATTAALPSVGATDNYAIELTLHSPQEARQTLVLQRTVGAQSPRVMWDGFHVFNGTAQFDGFIFTTSGTFTNGFYSVYGFRNS